MVLESISAKLIADLISTSVKKLLDLLKRKPTNDKQNVGVVASRFIQLFEKHGVHRNQIPQFFGYGLELPDFADHEKLLAKLTPTTLQAACELFAVRLKWLLGVDDIIYETHDFYKQPEAYAEFIAQLTTDNEHRILAKLVLSSDSSREEDALLVLEEEIDFMNNESGFRYHLCDGWVNKYWKCKPCLTACIAMTLKQNVHIRGWKTSSKIEAFCQGKGFINDLYELPPAFEYDWLLRRSIKDWHPDNWIYDPVDFLEGIDAEINNFGKTSAIREWLKYFDKGYMETGYPRENARAKFALELEKYQ
jgi:hypothetical protein